MALKDYRKRYKIIEGYIKDEKKIKEITDNLKNILFENYTDKTYLFFKSIFYEDISREDARYLYNLLIIGDYIKDIDSFISIYRRKVLVGFLATCRKIEISVDRKLNIA